MVLDRGRNWVEATNLGLAGVVMMVILARYNRSFNDLIRSQRTLRMRRDESEKLAAENRRIALTDALSGLPNRRALIARLESRQARAGEAGEIAVMFVDLDGFKQINDDYGHELGDALICRVGEALAGLVPPGAMLCRMGGDEFAVLIEGAEVLVVAHELGGRILARLALPVEVCGHALHIGASIGIAGGSGIDPQELLRRSDAAMYRAKAGRAGVLAYDPSFDAGREHRKLIESEIRLGLERGEFDVAYQPLVDARSGDVLAVEALARWPGRPRGPLNPNEFIAIAETSGLIHPLGLFVLRRACRDLRRHAALRLNVNISPAQFRHPRFEAEVANVLEETGFPPTRLQIEITEGYLVDHPERAARAIAAFRAMGVSVALDDFGSGFASIGYLRSFGFSAIKIDKSLSVGLGHDAKAALVIAGIVHLANGFDVDVTAEGVETETQAAMLRLAGCRELQGYLFGRPAGLAQVLAPGARPGLAAAGGSAGLP
jgi:diguanylate cyclase (GGDEF)-like protein